MFAVALLAGCGGSGASSPSPTPTGSSSPEDELAAMDECMEREGHDFFSVDAEGRTEVDFGSEDPDFQADFDRCRSETGFDSFGPPNLSPEDQARANEELVDMVGCMAERGWQLEIVPGQLGGVILPTVEPGDQAIFDRDLADCSGGDMVQAEPVQP